MHFLLRRHAGDFLVVDLLGVRVVHRAGDARVEIGIPERAPRMIFDPRREGISGVQLLLLAGRRHQLVLDDILQQDALAVFWAVIAEPRSDLGGGKIEIGLLDLDAVDARHDRVVGSGRQRDKSDERCKKQQR